MALKGKIVDIVMEAADRFALPRAALLAVVEVESNGVALEMDGRTPRLLFERHVFHRELKARAPHKLKIAVEMGLAIPKWSRDTQYKDQGASADRLALIGRARTVDVECANRSCSWGLGQTMGFLAEELGYRDATAMVAQMTERGLRGQVAMMCLEIQSKRLEDALALEDWAKFARAYNGPAYAQNRYDTKLAAAHRRWTRQLEALESGTLREAAHQRLEDFEIAGIQQRLKDLGYYNGDVDKLWGPLTTGAVSAFQQAEGLPVTGDYDERLRDALAAATPRVVADARANTTAEDLRKAGSQTVKEADRGTLWAKILVMLGLAGGSEEAGLLDTLRGYVDQVQQLRPLVTGLRDVLSWIGGLWWLAAIVAGLVLWRQFGAIIKRRIADRIEGRHA